MERLLGLFVAEGVDDCAVLEPFLLRLIDAAPDGDTDHLVHSCDNEGESDGDTESDDVPVVDKVALTASEGELLNEREEDNF